MANGTFRLRGRELMKQRGLNLHKTSQRGQVTYSTVHRYMDKPEDVKAVSLSVLYGFLIDGLGIKPEELSEMRFGDIFEILPNNSVYG